jgi:hypothetical protein
MKKNNNSKVTQMSIDTSDLEIPISEITRFIDNLKSKYGEDIIERLEDFKGYKLLSSYLDYAYKIDNRKKILPDFDSKMTHLLFKIIKHHTFSFFDLLYYNPKGKPYDLETSYKTSAAIASSINDDKENIAWYSNMKLPSTYSVTDEVYKHYSYLWEGFNDEEYDYSKNNCGILQTKNADVRRIHIYFDKLNDGKLNEETIKLFTTLMIEFLLGIESKVLIINNYHKIKSKIISLSKDTEAEILSIFLLDFALYYNKSNNTGYSHLPGDYYSLCSDFVFEDLDDRKIDSEIRKENYQKEKVYLFNDPKIYAIFKYYFLSIWNLEAYVSFLEKQHPEIFLNGEDKLKTEFIDTLKNNFRTLDFFSFWRYIKLQKFDDLFDENYFAAFFPKSIKNSKPNYTEKLQQISKLIEFPSNEINVNEIEKRKNEYIIELNNAGLIMREKLIANIIKK